MALQSAAAELRLLAQLSTHLVQTSSTTDLHAVSVALDAHLTTLIRDNARHLPTAVPLLQLQVLSFALSLTLRFSDTVVAVAAFSTHTVSSCGTARGVFGITYAVDGGLHCHRHAHCRGQRSACYGLSCARRRRVLVRCCLCVLLAYVC